MKTTKTTKTKKYGILLIVALLICGLLISCDSTSGNNTSDTATQGTAATDTTPTTDNNTANEKLSVFAMNGPTGISLAKLTQNGRYEFVFADSADEALADLIGGKYDIVSIPTNLAAVLSVKAAGVYKIAAVNTLGVLYMIDSDGSVKSVSDLRGKTIYATGEGLIPGFVLEYVLEKNGLVVGEDVNIEYFSTPAEVGSILLSGKTSVAMLPQPYVTTLLAKSENSLNIALDMTQEFDNISSDECRLMTSCIAVNVGSLADKGVDISNIIDDVRESVRFVNEENDEAAKLVSELGIIPSEQIAKTAIPLCKTVCLSGEEMKTSLLGFYKSLYDFKPSLCGGKLPDEEIFA